MQAPKVFGNARSDEEVRSTYQKSVRFLSLQPADLNASGLETPGDGPLLKFDARVSVNELNGEGRNPDARLTREPSFHTPRGRAPRDSSDHSTVIHDHDTHESTSKEVPITVRAYDEIVEEPDLHTLREVELNRKRLVHMILTELGHTPADDDLEYDPLNAHTRPRTLATCVLTSMYS